MSQNGHISTLKNKMLHIQYQQGIMSFKREIIEVWVDEFGVIYKEEFLDNFKDLFSLNKPIAIKLVALHLQILGHTSFERT